MDSLGERNIRNYKTDSDFEQTMRNKFDALYMTYFVGLKEIKVIKDKQLQYRGHDVHLVFDNETIVLDEKVRRWDYDDILIEYLSDKERNIPGWIYKNESDYLAYLFPTKGLYFIKTQRIKDLVNDKNSFFWQLPDIESENDNGFKKYTTVSKAIPILTLEENDLILAKIPIISLKADLIRGHQWRVQPPPVPAQRKGL